MKIPSILFAGAVLCAPVAAFADNTLPVAPVTTATPTAGKSPTDPNRVICKSEEETGSRISTHKTCMTAAQWKEQMFRANQWAEHMTTYNAQPNGR